MRYLLPAILLLFGCQPVERRNVVIDPSDPNDVDAALPDPGVDAHHLPDGPAPECTGVTCADEGNPCTQNLCVNGHCQYPKQNDGLACHDGTSGHDGRCYVGVCCVGCWNGNTCITGTALDACGSSGHVCQDCDDNKECTADTCLSVANACTHSNRNPGTPCSIGTCGGGAQDGVCEMVQAPICGGAGETCCAGYACNQAGTACDLSTNKCEYCGSQDQLCCLIGGAYACNDTHLACESGTCRCGGEGEPCCNSVISPCNAPFQCNAGTCFHP